MAIGKTQRPGDCEAAWLILWMVSVRDLGDVHLPRSSIKVVSGTDALDAWGSVAVLYLNGNSSTDVRAFNGSSSGVNNQMNESCLSPGDSSARGLDE